MTGTGRSAKSGVASHGDVEAIEAGAPALPPCTYEMIRRGAAIDPDAPALTFFASVDVHRQPTTWTYRELVARITQTANFFHRLGARKESVIALALPNLPETHFAIWGAEAAGIAMPLNPLLEGPAFAALLEASEAEILVTVAPRPGAEALWRRLEAAIVGARGLRHVVFVGLAGGDPPLLPERVAIHDFSSAIAQEDPSALASGRVFQPSDPSSWFATGGTTGLPKLAMRCHQNEVANAWSVSQAVGDAIGPGKVVLCGLPLFHVNGVLVTGLLPFSVGAHVVLATAEGYRAPGMISRFWEIVEHYRVNFFSGVPTIYASLLQIPVGSRDVSSLDYGLCGAAPLPVEVLRTFEERTGLRILEGYGLTEGTCVSSVNPVCGQRRAGSIGLRLPGQLMKAVVLDERGAYARDCAPGEVGVIVVSGPNVFAGYRRRDQDAGLWVDHGGRRWLNTGDLGYQDAEGYFYLTGRKKELIIRGGHNIDPAAIEGPLHRHPAVHMAAAIGRPDPHAGEVPVAYVQLMPGMKATEEELLSFVAAAIGERAARPKAIRIVDQLPVTAVGKLFKPALKHRETRDALLAALVRAGIHGADLAVADQGRGTTVTVALEDAADEAAARRVLGEFPFPFSIRPAA